MNRAEDKSVPHGEVIEVNVSDLPVYCPGPKAPLWSMHPRVYIELAKSGRGVCPYCSATYQLKPGQVVHNH